MRFPELEDVRRNLVPYRDIYPEFKVLGAEIYGISTQSTEDQKEFAQRLKIPYAILSDEHLKLSEALRLPTFSVPEGQRQR